MPTEYLRHGRRLAVRDVEERDGELLQTWFDTSARRHQYLGTDLDEFQIDDFSALLAYVRSAPDVEAWVAEVPGGKPLAFMTFRRTPAWSWLSEGEIMVAPDTGGLPGVGTEAFALGIDLVFARGAHKLWGHVALDNAASQRLVDKLGFREEGLLRQHMLRRSGPVDVRFMGLLRTDWSYTDHLAA